MCKICDKLVYGENLQLLTNRIDLANRSNLVLSGLTIYKHSENDTALLQLYTGMADYDQDACVPIYYCPFCGKAL